MAEQYGRPMRRRRLGVLVTTGGAVLVVFWAAVAVFACVPQARLVVIAPRASGPVGTQVSVEGIGFDPPPSTTEVRWNTADGPKLGSADQGDFAVSVGIPDVPPGLYGILVLSRGADGVLGNTGRATFQVTDEPAIVGAPPMTATPPVTFAAAPTVTEIGPSPGILAVGAVGLLVLGLMAGRQLGGSRRPDSGSHPSEAGTGTGRPPERAAGIANQPEKTAGTVEATGE